MIISKFILKVLRLCILYIIIFKQMNIIMRIYYLIKLIPKWSSISRQFHPLNNFISGFLLVIAFVMITVLLLVLLICNKWQPRKNRNFSTTNSFSNKCPWHLIRFQLSKNMKLHKNDFDIFQTYTYIQLSNEFYIKTNFDF